MKYSKLYLALFICAFAFAGCAQKDPGQASFGNKVYIYTETKVFDNYMTPDSDPAIYKTITASLAKPAEKDIVLTYKAAPEMTEKYNLGYYADATALPEEHYELTEPKATIVEGSVRSTEAEVMFKNIGELDMSKIFVLPVRIADADGMDILESGRTIYYIFKEAALINVVADIEDNYCVVNWASSVSGMSALTYEALVKANYFTRTGSDSEICSVMGIEGVLLIRTGDSNYPGQIQVAMSGKNIPGKDESKVLPTNEWLHIALTYDAADSRTMRIYINGKLQTEETVSASSFSLNSAGTGNIKGFLIGASWETNRWWPGDISEVRVWNKALTPEELNVRNHFYYVDPQSEGLVAYWRFNEGSGNLIYDHTGNGNNATAVKDIIWRPVELPVKE